MYARTAFIILALALVFAGQTISVPAACAGQVYYKYDKAQTLSIPIGWTIFQDMDNDGKKDLIGLNKSTTTSPTPASLVFYKRTASGYVTAPVISSLGSSFATFAMAVGDINGDGNLDILNTDTNAAPFTVTAYYGNGSGGFTAGPTSTIGYNSGTPSIGDLNGDGKGDLVTTSTSGVGYHLVQVDGTFGPYVNISPGQFFLTARLADFNADGKLDVLTWTVSAGKIMVNQGSGNFTAGATTSPYYLEEPNFIGDVNGDGRPDIVTNAHYAPDGSSWGFTIYLTEPGAASWAETSYIPGHLYRPNHSYLNTRVADVDGDGDLDVLFFTSKLYYVLRNNGSGAMAAELLVSTSLQQGFDDDAIGDAAADIISLNRPGIFNVLADSVKFSQSVCSKPGRTDFIDFDGDGNTDMGFFRPSDGFWQHRNSGGTFYLFTNISGFGTVGDIPASQDFNGDGTTDRAFFRPSTGTWSIRDAVTAAISNVQWGASGDRPVPSDYDGDGKADIGIYRPSNGTWWILYSSNGGYSVQSFGISEDIPVPMDYDGDHLSDIAVWRPSTGVWYIQKSAGGYFITPFGISTDKPVPGDYDDDGSADIAVFRNGGWYLARIRDSALSYVQYGQAGDVPIPFNHVGRGWGANFAVYRSTWLFDMGEISQGMPDMGGNKTTSTILPQN